MFTSGPLLQVRQDYPRRSHPGPVIQVRWLNHLDWLHTMQKAEIVLFQMPRHLAKETYLCNINTWLRVSACQFPALYSCATQEALACSLEATTCSEVKRRPLWQRPVDTHIHTHKPMKPAINNIINKGKEVMLSSLNCKPFTAHLPFSSLKWWCTALQPSNYTGRDIKSPTFSGPRLRAKMRNNDKPLLQFVDRSKTSDTVHHNIQGFCSLAEFKRLDSF